MILAGALFAAAADGGQTFTGVITDSMCGKDHAAMKVSPESKCVKECVKAGSSTRSMTGRTYIS